MKIVDKKVDEIPENKFYGVDVNNKQAVEQEFLRLKKQHKTVTIVVIVALLILGIIFFDFCRVNFMDAKPIFAVEEKVERGTLFSGLGYKVLYCNNGDRYVGSVLYKTCVEQDEVEFTNLIYEKLVNYLKDEKLFYEKFVYIMLNKPAGVVLEVLQKGYIYKDKVIRPAMVKVSE